ncbi:hypothetical protein EVAR_40878_1 [Eumeta japonica]|uniref:Factor VIII intron 22 protein n=1 Tax=Eumeta variegata TaxID=151549 RepID=A0A4C1X8D1_EUMVA|nr:hypothetical protein EVAR_40878_1 [Eumeta japonica]
MRSRSERDEGRPKRKRPVPVDRPQPSNEDNNRARIHDSRFYHATAEAYTPMVYLTLRPRLHSRGVERAPSFIFDMERPCCQPQFSFPHSSLIAIPLLTSISIQHSGSRPRSRDLLSSDVNTTKLGSSDQTLAGPVRVGDYGRRRRPTDDSVLPEPRTEWRFMRKPNVVEATNEFNALAIQCEHSEQPTFAGHAYIGAAKCESSAGNTLGEAENYLAAARQFMNAEIKLSSMKCYSPARENLEAAVGCYIQAINKYPEKSLLRTAALMELANNLAMLNHKLEAISYYMQALENIEENSAIQIKCLCTLLDINIQCNCLETALKIANRLSELKMRLPENVLIEIQISRILLALITEPTENDRTPSLKQLFADLLNDRDEASLGRTSEGRNSCRLTKTIRNAWSGDQAGRGRGVMQVPTRSC